MKMQILYQYSSRRAFGNPKLPWIMRKYSPVFGVSCPQPNYIIVWISTKQLNHLIFLVSFNHNYALVACVAFNIHWLQPPYVTYVNNLASLPTKTKKWYTFFLKTLDAVALESFKCYLNVWDVYWWYHLKTYQNISYEIFSQVIQNIANDTYIVYG